MVNSGPVSTASHSEIQFMLMSYRRPRTLLGFRSTEHCCSPLLSGRLSHELQSKLLKGGYVGDFLGDGLHENQKLAECRWGRQDRTKPPSRVRAPLETLSPVRNRGLESGTECAGEQSDGLALLLVPVHDSRHFGSATEPTTAGSSSDTFEKTFSDAVRGCFMRLAFQPSC